VRAIAAGGARTGESRIRAPEPRKLGWSGPERGLVAQKAHHEGNLGERTDGVREIPVVLVNRRGCRRTSRAARGQEGTARRTCTSSGSDRRIESLVASSTSSQRLQTSARDALHHPAKARRKGLGVDGRRSGSTKSPSFDEAAVAANLAFPTGERDRERQRLVCDRPLAEYATGKEHPSEGSRSRAYRSERCWSPWETRGHRQPRRS